MKVTVIGGGSTYTPELVHGFLAHAASLPISELWLMDIDQERLATVGGFAQRMVEAKGSPFKVAISLNQRESIRGAQYVITQIRVGMMQARREDEYLGLRHGIVGQETTGIGGMAKALRTIPVLLNIARDIREVAPGALLVNFTNPAGLVTEALIRYAPEVQSVGVCNVPITTQMEILEQLERSLGTSIDPTRSRLDTLGLNHLSWHRGFLLDGENVWPQILEEYLVELRASQDPEWDPEVIETLRMIPNDYLQYFYHTDRKLAAQRTWPPSRAEEVMEIEKGLLADYADPDRSQLPEDLMKRGGAYYSTLATQLLHSHYNDLAEIHVVNVRQGGQVPGWPADWVLEMPCRVDHTGIAPLPADPLPPVCFGLLAQVKMYELLTVEAAVHGDRASAIRALLANPLGPPAEEVSKVLDDLLETHKDHLPQFWA